MSHSFWQRGIGSTGTGKSKFLEWMILNDIENSDNGLCLIDPHGYLYDDIINWLASRQLSLKHRKIVLFNPADDDYFLGFNPFQHRSLETAHQVDTMVNACAKAWGAENLDTTPLLKKCLRCIFHALAETELTLLESLYFISNSQDSRVLRKHLIDKVKDPVIREVWQSFQDLSRREYNEQFSSSANRLIEFLSSKRIRRIIGQNKNTINFRKLMDEGYIVLVNLSSGQRLSRDNARLLGTLLINDLFLSATERKRTRTEPPKPFYLYIDECAQFLNEDIGHILDECRKFGLHLILAHQHLAQLRKAGDDIYASVMTDAKTKVIFGGLTPDDAEILAKQIYMGELDVDEIKKEIRSTKVMSYRLRWFRSEAQSEGSSDTEGETDGYSDTETDTEGSSETESESVSEGSSEARGTGSSESLSIPQDSPFYSGKGVLNTGTSEQVMSVSSLSVSSGSAHTEAHSHSSSHSEMHSNSKAHSEMKSRTEGVNEGLEPVMGKELTSVQYRSLEEQLYRAMAIMVNQPQQHCLLKMPLKRVAALKVYRVPVLDAIFNKEEDLLLKYQKNNFEKYKDQFIALREKVEADIVSRQAELLEKAHAEIKVKERAAKGSVEDLREGPEDSEL